MANHRAGLDPTWAYLPAPAAGHCCSTPAWLFPPAAAFENEALTSALRASMSPAATAAASSSASYPTTPSSSNSSASELLSGGNDAPAPASRPGPPLLARTAVGPKAGRVTKRKPRPSRRPPVTYITADPANFRRMVQEITGGFHRQATSTTASEHASSAPTSWPAPPAVCALPTLDTSAFLLDRAPEAPAPGLDDKSSSGGASPAMAVTAAAVEDDNDDSSVLQELEAMACAPVFVSDFPILESWGVL